MDGPGVDLYHQMLTLQINMSTVSEHLWRCDCVSERRGTNRNVELDLLLHSSPQLTSANGFVSWSATDDKEDSENSKLWLCKSEPWAWCDRMNVQVSLLGIVSTSWAHRESRWHDKLSKRGGGKVVLIPGWEMRMKALSLSSSGANFTFPGCPLMV